VNKTRAAAGEGRGEGEQGPRPWRRLPACEPNPIDEATLLPTTVPTNLEVRRHGPVQHPPRTPTPGCTIPEGDFYHRLGLPQRSAGYPRSPSPNIGPTLKELSTESRRWTETTPATEPPAVLPRALQACPFNASHQREVDFEARWLMLVLACVDHGERDEERVIGLGAEPIQVCLLPVGTGVFGRRPSGRTRRSGGRGPRE